MTSTRNRKTQPIKVALDMVSRGETVIRLQAQSKIPVDSAWQNDPEVQATTPEQVSKLWGDGGYNVGLAVTKGRLVLDIDGDEGEEHLKLLEEKFGPLPKTWTIRTTSQKGRHLHFSYKGAAITNRRVGLGAALDMKVSSKKKDPRPLLKIDVRGKGGQVVAPGCAVRDDRYDLPGKVGVSRIIEDIEVAEAPGWLLKVLRGVVTRPKVAVDDRTWAKVLSALGHVDGGTYDEWVEVGMMLHTTGRGEAFDTWVDWSTRQPKFQGADDCAKHWKTFNADREGAKTFASLFHDARENGWQPDADNRNAFFNAVPKISPGELPVVVVTKSGAPKADQTVTDINIHALCKVAGVGVRHNVMDKAIDFVVPDDLAALLPDEPERQVKADLFAVAVLAGMRNQGAFTNSLEEVGYANMFHPFEDWALSKPWDGVPRFEALVATVETPEDERPALRAFLHRWLLQTVQATRGWRNPQQMGGVLVFVGPQGRYKTTWFKMLATTPFFGEGKHLNLGGHNKDADTVAQATKYPITELGELDGTLSRADMKALNNFLTRTIDEYRKPYARDPVNHPRATSFCGTANSGDLITDDTGSRRFWPVTIEWCRTDLLADIDIQQLWAEYCVLWEKGTQYHLTEEEDALRISRARDYDNTPAVADAILSAYDEKTLNSNPSGWTPMTTHRVLRNLGLPINNYNAAKAAAVMTQLFGKRKKEIRGVRRAWLAPHV